MAAKRSGVPGVGVAACLLATDICNAELILPMDVEVKGMGFTPHFFYVV